MTVDTTSTRAPVGPSRRAEAAAITETLAAAFHTDPVFRWILPDDAHRATANRAFFGLVVDILADHDATWTATDPTAGAEVTGAALWVPHGRPAMSDEQAERFVTEALALSGPHPDRMLDVITLLDGQHPAEPHEYLWFLGVRPTEQGRGIGSALLAPALRRADAAGHPCYLEATSPRNRDLYRRHGFQPIAEIAVPGGPTLWPMWREPLI